MIWLAVLIPVAMIGLISLIGIVVMFLQVTQKPRPKPEVPQGSTDD